MTSSDREAYVTTRELLEMAIRFEDESVQYYENLKDAVDDDEAQGVLDLLAAEEREHARRLRERESEMGNREGEMLQFPPDLALAMPVLEVDEPGFRDLLDHAIRREQHSQRIYEHVAAIARGDMEELAETLAIFEEEHEERIRSLRDNY